MLVSLYIIESLIIELLYAIVFLFRHTVILYLIISMRLYLHYRSEPNQRHTFLECYIYNSIFALSIYMIV